MDSGNIESQKKDFAPLTASAYLDPHYWDQRFAAEEHYEWFKDYTHFQHLIQQYVKSTDSVLELGCGNSQLCEGLYKDGITNITCTDLSAIAVENMHKRLLAKGYEDIKVRQVDMLKLPFGDQCFDVIIEKGTVDVLFVDSGDPWNPKPATVEKVMAMLEGVHRVLKPDGIFISISFGQPHFRRPLFEAPKFTWSMEWSTFGDGFHYFFYTLKKGSRPLDCESLTDHPFVYYRKSWRMRIISSELILMCLKLEQTFPLYPFTLLVVVDEVINVYNLGRLRLYQTVSFGLN